MSLILSSFVTALGGVLAGLTLAGGLLWRQHQALTAARSLAGRAQHEAHHDDTTGLPNRRAFLARLRQALHSSTPVGVVLLDLDHFKDINDTFGHEAGNDLLTEIGRRLSDLDHPVVLAARLSGDEFVLLVDGGRDEVAAAASAAGRAIGAHPVPIGAQAVSVRASVGYATATLGASPRLLLHQADEAMYEAKRSGVGIHAATLSTAQSEVLPRRRRRDLRPGSHPC